MNKETRIIKIQEILERDKENPFGKVEIPWEDKLETMNVYKIPLEVLVYNKYNGRILSRTQSLERQNQVINAETKDGKEIIEKLLWESNDTRNKATEKSIEDYGQQKVGIITKDGIIIDGNRRAMLLNRSKKFDYFKCVVLNVTLEEKPLEIEKLETTYQMGEDEKVSYNSTEKYIKTKLLYLKISGKKYSSNVKKHEPNKKTIEKIALWMGEEYSEIVKYLNVMEIMDEYLEYLKYDGIYTQLDEREDQFISLQRWLKNLYGESSKKGFDGYKDDDVDDLQTIAFDYIRIRPHYDGKDFRLLADGQNSNHFFGDKEIWRSFSKYHFENTKLIQIEDEIDYNSTNLTGHLNDRDDRYFEKTGGKKNSSLFENIDIHRTKLGNKQASDQPQKLVDKALDAINAIKTNHSKFSTPEVQNQLMELGKKIMNIQTKKSPSRALAQVIDILENIDLNKIPNEEKDEVKSKANQINQMSYKIKKEL